MIRPEFPRSTISGLANFPGSTHNRSRGFKPLNAAFHRALLSLSHPISIAAIAILLLNDHVWRRVAPWWLTGKIGDFAWLVFAPFLMAAMLAWLVPHPINRRTEFVGRISILLTGLIFGLAKTSPFIHDAIIHFLQTINGWANNLLIDPTDLLTLPALWISWRIWHSPDRSLTPARVWPLLVIAILVTTGTSPAYVEVGIRQFVERGTSIYVGDFHSDDGGLTWLTGGDKQQQYVYGKYTSWQLIDPANDRVVYQFNKGVSIERSDDGGLTWRRDFDLSGEQARTALIGSALNSALGPFDAIIQRSTGNLIVAMGLEGVLVRSANGDWRWVQVGSFSVPQMNTLDRITSLLSGELWLGAALIGLLIGSFVTRFDLRQIVTMVLGTIFILMLIGGWIYWLIQPAFFADEWIFGAITLILTVATIFFGRRRSRVINFVLIIVWLALAIGWVSSSLNLQYHYNPGFKMALGTVLVVITIAIGLRPRRGLGGLSILPTILVIVLSVVAEGWTFWFVLLPPTAGFNLFTELTGFFGLATIGLTLFSIIWPTAFSRTVRLVMWGSWLLIGFALVVQFRYLSTNVIAAIVLVTLTLGLMAVAHRKNLFDVMTRTAIVLGWLEWVLAFVVIKPALPDSAFIDFNLALPAIVIPAIIAGAWRALKLYRETHDRALKLFLISGAGALGYALPFVLWTQGAIPFYDTAALYAVGLALAILIAGKQYAARRLNAQNEIVTPAMGES